MSNKIGLCKYCWEVLCSQCQENLIDDDNDHVSKSELRKWCEGRINICTRTKTSEAENELQCRSYYDVLEKFCEGEK